MSFNQILTKALRINPKSCSTSFSINPLQSYVTDSLVKVEKLDEIVEIDQKTSVKTITVRGPVDVSLVTGIPEEHIKDRLVRIYQRPKNVMQSGTNNVGQWEIEFETRSRWENPLMGWASTGDPHSNVKVQFDSLESAKRYVEKNGWQWFVEPEKKIKPKTKSYGFNFSWNKRSRVSTK